MNKWIAWVLCIFTISAANAAGVDQRRAVAANSDESNWLLHGRTYDEQRHSPLRNINTNTVDQLGLAWSFDTQTNRALEATPIVVDGVMYFSGVWNIVYAVDARSGKELWRFDPKVPRQVAWKLCCDAISRGVALWQDKVITATLDGRLIALDARTGESLWSTQTLDPETAASITGPVRVVKDKVIIGNGGAEYGVRGFVSAYDVNNGEMIWRFYTVPGNPADGFESDAMAMAAKTWTGQWWKLGGGGTVWDHMAYDAQLDLLYVGVGNGAPWNRQLRSPEGGDNLFLSSIVAVRPDTGEYVWHYQVVPSETWDYTATQHMILADIEINGELRKVIMQAPKSGFFMVIDRVTGKLISAEPFVKVTWASHYDLATGRPVEVAGQDYVDGSALVSPSSGGGHNWQPMAFNPETGLVYIPAMESAMSYEAPEQFTVKPRGRNQGTVRPMLDWDELFHRTLSKKISGGHLLAWDPVKQRAAWTVDLATVWNGGVLSTAGGLVFQGNGDGRFVAYAADSGKTLWEVKTQSPILAAPITYQVDGEQYVTVLVGNGGAFGLMSGIKPPPGPEFSRVLTYKLGATGTLPGIPQSKPIPDPPEKIDDSDLIAKGNLLYAEHCSYCHGVSAISGGTIPDLRHAAPAIHDNFSLIVGQGYFESMGMPSFKGVLNQQEIEAIHAYVIEQGHKDKVLREEPHWKSTLRLWVYEVVTWLIATLLGGSSSSA